MGSACLLCGQGRWGGAVEGGGVEYNNVCLLSVLDVNHQHRVGGLVDVSASSTMTWIYIITKGSNHAKAYNRIVEEIYDGTLSAPQYRPRLVPKCAPGYQFLYFWC